MTNTTFNTREVWLNATMAVVVDEILSLVATAHNIDLPPVRYSVTAPKTTGQKKGKVLGECWSRAASSDGHNEIFLTSLLGESDSIQVLAVSIHEYIHAMLDNQHGHGGPFITLCTAAGLQGGPTGRSAASFTATVPTPALIDHLKEIIADLGDFPHAAMAPALNGKKTQKNRQLLVACNRCDFKFRASQKTIDSIKYTDCLSCDGGQLAPKV